MRRKARWAIILGALAYAAPTVLPGPIHALEMGEWAVCSECKSSAEAGAHILADCSSSEKPCRKPGHHHHGDSHHPGQCQVCKSIDRRPVALTGEDVPGSPPTTFVRFCLPEDFAPLETIRPFHSRGPPRV